MTPIPRCALSQKAMDTPVIANCGHVFEQDAILRSIVRQLHCTHPIGKEASYFQKSPFVSYAKCPIDNQEITELKEWDGTTAKISNYALPQLGRFSPSAFKDL